MKKNTLKSCEKMLVSCFLKNCIPDPDKTKKIWKNNLIKKSKYTWNENDWNVILNNSFFA